MEDGGQKTEYAVRDSTRTSCLHFYDEIRAAVGPGATVDGTQDTVRPRLCMTSKRMYNLSCQWSQAHARLFFVGVALSIPTYFTCPRRLVSLGHAPRHYRHAVSHTTSLNADTVIAIMLVMIGLAHFRSMGPSKLIRPLRGHDHTFSVS